MVQLSSQQWPRRSKEGDQDPPVFERLVGSDHLLSGMSPTHTTPSQLGLGPWVGGQSGLVGADTQTGLQFCRVSVQPQGGPGETHPGQVVRSPSQV